MNYYVNEQHRLDVVKTIPNRDELLDDLHQKILDYYKNRLIRNPQFSQILWDKIEDLRYKSAIDNQTFMNWKSKGLHLT